jgi:nucleotide-binding universal stress UspA family protein
VEVDVFGRILVPLDGSSLAELALRHVEALAEVCQAEVFFLRVLERERRSNGAAEDVLAWDFRRVEAEAYLEKLAARLRSRGTGASLAVEEGDAAERILKHVIAHGIDLLVLTSHGHGGITEFKVAGTARKILSRSPVSVLLIPARDSPTVDRNRPLYRTVATLVDCSQRGDCAVNVASHVARAMSAELVLVHVVPEPELTARMPLDAEDLALIERVVLRNRRAADRYLSETRARLSGSGHPVRVHSSVARDVARALTDFLSKERPELVVTCARGSTARSDRSFGTVARSLLTGARVPVLVVQDARMSHRPDRDAATAAFARNGQRATARDH